MLLTWTKVGKEFVSGPWTIGKPAGRTHSGGNRWTLWHASYGHCGRFATVQEAKDAVIAHDNISKGLVSQVWANGVQS